MEKEGNDDISFHGGLVHLKNRKERKYEIHRKKKKKHSIQKWAKRSEKNTITQVQQT